MDGREIMLGGIRAALGRASASGAPEALPPVSCEESAIPPEDIVNRFCEELEHVGGCAARLESGDEVKEYLEKLLRQEDNPVVAVADDAIIRSTGLHAWLGDTDACLIPTLREFASLPPLNSKTKLVGDGASLDGRPLMDEYKSALLKAHIGITSAEYGIAETGTLVLHSGHSQTRLISLLPPIHVCLLHPSRITGRMCDLLASVRAAFAQGRTLPQSMTFITGPSCTADIEQTLVKGMHGPRELHVLLSSSIH